MVRQRATKHTVGLSSELIERRPDVRAAEQKLKAANAAVGMAYTNRFPKLSLTAQGGLESEEFANFMRSPMYFLSAGILGPIFDGGKRQAQYRAGRRPTNSRHMPTAIQLYRHLPKLETPL